MNVVRWILGILSIIKKVLSSQTSLISLSLSDLSFPLQMKLHLSIVCIRLKKRTVANAANVWVEVKESVLNTWFAQKFKFSLDYFINALFREYPNSFCHSNSHLSRRKRNRAITMCPSTYWEGYLLWVYKLEKGPEEK